MSYPFAERQSVYSTALADWAKFRSGSKVIMLGRKIYNSTFIHLRLIMFFRELCSPCNIVVNVVDCNIIVSESSRAIVFTFELKPLEEV